MNYIVLTDLYGNTIFGDNSVPFIIIRTEISNNILEKIDINIHQSKDTLWKFNKQYLNYILQKYGFDKNKFIPLGHIWFLKNTKQNKKMFLLINTNNKLSRKPINYEKIAVYGSKYIWKPIAPKDFMALGYMCSSQKPALNEIHVISNNVLKRYNNKYNSCGLNRNMNEFNYFGRVSSITYTIDRNNYILKNGIYNDIKSFDSCSTESWITPTGKFVTLIEPDEPWFIKKQKSIKKKIKQNKINNKINTSDNIETFEEEETSLFAKTIDVILLCLFLTILTMLICRLYLEIRNNKIKQLS
jgi:hypothetical protein